MAENTKWLQLKKESPIEGAAILNPEYDASVGNIEAACGYLNEALSLSKANLLHHGCDEEAIMTRGTVPLLPNTQVDNHHVYQKPTDQTPENRVTTFPLVKRGPRGQDFFNYTHVPDGIHIGPQVCESVSFEEAITQTLDNRDKIRGCPEIPIYEPKVGDEDIRQQLKLVGELAEEVVKRNAEGSFPLSSSKRHGPDLYLALKDNNGKTTYLLISKVFGVGITDSPNGIKTRGFNTAYLKKAIAAMNSWLDK